MKKYLLYLVALLILVLPVSGAVEEIWNVSTPDNVTAVDTNYDASIIIIGTSGGNISIYNLSGSLLSLYRTNVSHFPRGIKKLVSTSNGDTIWSNEANQAGYLTSANVSTTIKTWNHGTPILNNITDIAITADGGYWAMITQTPPRVFIYDSVGTLVAENTSINGPYNWTKVGFDASMSWLVTANKSNNTLLFWNVTPWNGWDQFNPNKTGSKNASQINIDRFQFRSYLNISIPPGYDATITFQADTANTSNLVPIVKYNNSHYWYRQSMTGTRMFFTPINYLPNASNTSDNQSYVLNMSYYLNGNYTVSLRNVSNGNFTIYYGCGTYSFTKGTYITPGTSVTLNYTSNSIWMRPSNAIASLSYTVVGGGGGAGSGGVPTATSGYGGSASTAATGTLLLPTGLYSVPVYVGSGGSGADSGAGIAGGSSAINATPGDVLSRTSTGGAGGAAGLASTTAGTGGSGIINASTYYATNGVVGTGWDGAQCALNGYTGGSAGGGYGAGGGGGGYGTGSCTPNGGNGANGIVKLVFTQQYTAPTSGDVTGREDRQTGYSLNQSSIKFYVGEVSAMDIAPNGGYVVITTNQSSTSLYGSMYKQPVSSVGFDDEIQSYYGSTYAPFSGDAVDVKTSNSAAITTEARDIASYIYDYNGNTKAQTIGADKIYVVDVDVQSALVAGYGGAEGRLGLSSRTGSSTWYTLYTGSVGDKITALSISWDGAYAVIGRSGTTPNGTVQVYATNVTTSGGGNVTNETTTVEAYVKVYKDGQYYAYQPVAVFAGTGSTGPWTAVANLSTDSDGHISYAGTTGIYYKFVVNSVGGTDSGEGSSVWLANTGSTVVNIYILSPSTPYEWNAYYDTDTQNVTVIYSDTITPVSVGITINDLKTGTPVFSQIYYATQSCNVQYHDQLGNGSYQVILVANRLGTDIRDTRMVSSPNTYKLAVPFDQYIVYAFSTIILMLIAGIFSYLDSKRGSLIVVCIAAFMIYFGLLPFGLITVAMLAALFAVLSLFGTRV